MPLNKFPFSPPTLGTRPSQQLYILKANADPYFITGLIIRSPFLLLRIEAVTAASENLFMHTTSYNGV